MGLRSGFRRAIGATPGSAASGRPEPPAGRFIWSAPGRGGAVGYALRQAVQAELGPPQPTDADFFASFADIDIEENGGSWLRNATLYVDPRGGDWSPFLLPSNAVVHDVICIADDATTTRLVHGTRLGYRGHYPDQTEGIEGDLLEVLDGPYAGTYVYLGTGGRYGAPSWAVERTMLPGGHPLLDDSARSEAIVAMMRAVAVNEGAPGYQR